MVDIILFCKLFFFILSCLNLLKNIYSFIKVIKMEQGHFDNGKYGNLLFGISLSYIITTLIIGF
jgi:hypothetical protein